MILLGNCSDIDIYLFILQVMAAVIHSLYFNELSYSHAFLFVSAPSRSIKVCEA